MSFESRREMSQSEPNEQNFGGAAYAEAYGVSGQHEGQGSQGGGHGPQGMPYEEAMQAGTYGGSGQGYGSQSAEFNYGGGQGGGQNYYEQGGGAQGGGQNFYERGGSAQGGAGQGYAGQGYEGQGGSRQGQGQSGVWQDQEGYQMGSGAGGYGGQGGFGGRHQGDGSSNSLMNAALSDSTLLQALQDAQSTMSQQGFTTLEHSLTQQLRMNPRVTDATMFSNATNLLQNMGDTQDISALGTVVQNDLSGTAAGSTSDATLVSQTSAAQPQPDSSTASGGGGQVAGSDASAAGTSSQTAPTAQQLIQALQQAGDTPMAQAMTDAQGSMSAQGFQALESYVVQNYGTTDDATLLNSAAQQLQTSSPQDAQVLQAVAQQDLGTASQGSATTSDASTAGTTGTATAGTSAGTESAAMTGSTTGAASSDPVISALQQAGDTPLAQALTDAQSAMSSQGYQALESYVTQNYGQNGVSDSALITNFAQQLQSSDPQDAQVLQAVAQQDLGTASQGSAMTSDASTAGTTGTSTAGTSAGTESAAMTGSTTGATSSDPVISALQQAGDTPLAQALTDAQSAMSSQGYQALESYVTQNYGQNGVSDSALITNFAQQLQSSDPQDAQVLQQVIAADLSSTGGGTQSLTGSDMTGAGTTASTGTMGTTDASAGTTAAGSSSSAAQQMVSALQQAGDTPMAQAMSDASTYMSAQGFQSITQAVEQGYGTTSDSALLSGIATQLNSAGDTQDAQVLQQVVAQDLPQTATTATAGSSAAALTPSSFSDGTTGTTSTSSASLSSPTAGLVSSPSGSY